MNPFAAVAVLLVAPVLAHPVVAQQKPYEVRAQGDTLTLTIEDEGMAMLDFVKVAQTVTGRVLTFSAAEIAAADNIKQIGTVRFEGTVDAMKAAYWAFFKTRLHIEGFMVKSHGEGDAEVFEIVALPGSKEGRPGDAAYVAVDDLEAHKAGKSMILTTLPLAQVDAQTVIDRLRPALAATNNQARLGRAGATLLAQGTGADVYCVARMVRFLDAAPMMVLNVVTLKHAIAEKLVEGLRALVAGRQPAVVVAAHGAANALMISGPRATVTELIELVTLLDTPARKPAKKPAEKSVQK